LIRQRRQGLGLPGRQRVSTAASDGFAAQPPDDRFSLQGSNSTAAPKQEGFPHRWKVVVMMAVSEQGGLAHAL